MTMHWRVFQDMTGMAAMKKIHEMKKIEEGYMAARSDAFETIIPDDVVVINIGKQEQGVLPGIPRPVLAAGAGSRMMMTANGLRLRR